MANNIGGPVPKRIKLGPQNYKPGLQRILQLGKVGAKKSTSTARTPFAGEDSSASAARPNTGTVPLTGGANKFDFNNLVPFVSNLANSFRKVPNPAAPNLIAPVSFAKPTNATELRDIDSTTLGFNRGADQGLDSNTAAAVKAGNLATNLKAKGVSYERTKNQGIALDNQAASINANINMTNMQKLDQYGEAKVNAQIAGQRESADNLANASDKFVQIQARKDAMDLDRQKFDILSKAYANSGVTDRLVKQILKKKPEDQVTPEDYDQVLNNSRRMFGGPLRIKKLGKHEGSTPPEMAGQYMASGGRIGGSIMHTPKLTRTRQLKKLY